MGLTADQQKTMQDGLGDMRDEVAEAVSDQLDQGQAKADKPSAITPIVSPSFLNTYTASEIFISNKAVSSSVVRLSVDSVQEWVN